MEKKKNAKSVFSFRLKESRKLAPKTQNLFGAKTTYTDDQLIINTVDKSKGECGRGLGRITKGSRAGRHGVEVVVVVVVAAGICRSSAIHIKFVGVFVIVVRVGHVAAAARAVGQHSRQCSVRSCCGHTPSRA